jgi:hypothetical protein
MSRQFSEEEMQAIDAEMDKLGVDDVLLQTLVTLINLGARKAGLAAPPTSTEPPVRDLDEARLAIDGARALLPLLEARHAGEMAPIKDALSRLQMAWLQLSGAGPGAAPDAPAAPAAPPKEEKPGTGPAQSSGRLWIPGQ